MTSLKQIDANRLNARKSTGPTTVEGKERSRCNAIRHGLTAQTVIGALEDTNEYKSFEAAILADFDPRCALEQELVLRLASLLWRLRRALAMETGLFDIQADQVKWSAQNCKSAQSVRDPSETIFTLDQSLAVPRDEPSPERNLQIEVATDQSKNSPLERLGRDVDLARCFLRLANLPNFALDRLSRYESMLSRQVAQVLFALETLHRSDR